MARCGGLREVDQRLRRRCQEEWHHRRSSHAQQPVARGYQRGPRLRGNSCELHVQAKGKASWRNRLNHHACHAKKPSRLANYGMVLGETLAPGSTETCLPPLKPFTLCLSPP